MAVYSDNSVCIFIYNDPIGIHAEGTYIIFKFFCAVYDLAFVQFICQVGEDHSRDLYTHTDIHTVGFGRDIQFFTYFFHPFAAASSY